MTPRPSHLYVDSDTPPCLQSKRHRVYRHHVHMCSYMWTCCWHTRGRFECTHGGVLNPHTGFSTFFQRATTHTHTKHTPRPPTTPRPQRHTHTTQHTTSHGDCGEVVDVVSVLTPVGSGVAQVFHDLLVELRLLLVAEEEEGEEEI